MGWLQRLFGQEKPADAEVNPTATVVAQTSPEGETIPPERVGLSGEYDQSGLAKRVALAFDEDSRVTNLDSVYVAQLGTTVVLKGQVPSQETLDQLVEIAQGVNGASAVTTDQVTVG
ncbi:BON domain-containing protein [Fortiea contorta]|uniref:BON domain-containing protein n=1 Tax=Fortiea contorta TaxID=1892405 RepID=UPI00034D41B4|nr:BON domain-containing protein [Fortiea contorta]